MCDESEICGVFFFLLKEAAKAYKLSLAPSQIPFPGMSVLCLLLVILTSLFVSFFVSISAVDYELYGVFHAMKPDQCRFELNLLPNPGFDLSSLRV